MTTIYRELTKIKELIEDLGFVISYPFDDLLFIDSNAFLIQFDDANLNSFFLHLNDRLSKEVQTELKDRITSSSSEKGLKINPKGQFQLKQKEGSDNEVELKFIP
ncbi:hypothetical protein QUH73_08035 [Labilibaculum sp. K2S]|uniref:hypothetical protein n=1 Tax=Labilibaculum sp. K2S TaxID=3056386 RepID=UPI0025A316D8|nr:hypothetical protein [Labilibaculum sp. K2S]MDM8159757.1 hypothetical protein [Labilibaculum sp. K2S]